MDCNGTPAGVIACAIDRASQPGPFEIVSALVVPTVLGLITLVVAIASWRVASSSHALARAIEDKRTRDASAAQQIQIVEQVMEWARVRWPADGQTKDYALAHALLGRVRAMLLTWTGPSGKELDEYLFAMDELATPKSRKTRTYLAGYATGSIHAALWNWVREPGLFAQKSPGLIEAIPTLIDKAEAAAERSEQRA